MRAALIAALVAGSLSAPAAHARPGRGEDARLAAIVRAQPGCPAGRTHCVGLQLHVTVRADGPIATPDWVATQLTEANRHFAPLGVGFTVVAIDALPASAEHVATRRDRNRFASHLGGPVLHVFVIGTLDDVDVPGEVRRGVAWHVPGDARKYVLLSTVAPPRVLAHELGHVFGLPHSSYPISIMNKTERADPPVDQRTFADEEIAAMRPVLAQLLRAKAIADTAK